MDNILHSPPCTRTHTHQHQDQRHIHVEIAAQTQDIILRESVQRRFTKRIPGLGTMTYYSRLKKINLESLELRRLQADFTLVYKILFGVISTKSDKLFSLRNQPQLRGHNYTLNKPRCNSHKSHPVMV